MVKEAKLWVFLSLLLKQIEFFEAAGAEVKIGSRLKQNCHIKLGLTSLSKFLINTVTVKVKPSFRTPLTGLRFLNTRLNSYAIKKFPKKLDIYASIYGT